MALITGECMQKRKCGQGIEVSVLNDSLNVSRRAVNHTSTVSHQSEHLPRHVPTPPISPGTSQTPGRPWALVSALDHFPRTSSYYSSTIRCSNRLSSRPACCRVRAPPSSSCSDGTLSTRSSPAAARARRSATVSSHCQRRAAPRRSTASARHHVAQHKEASRTATHT